MARLEVAPLWRFYAGDAATAGEVARVQQGVAAWATDLREALDGLPAGAVAGVAGDGAIESFDLDASGWTALRLLCFYAQRSDLEWPDDTPHLPELDKRWREAADEGFTTSPYGQLLVSEMWLPADFSFTARVPMPDGADAELGSALLAGAQLGRLNRATVGADRDALAAWESLPAPVGSPFVDGVRRSLGTATAAFASAGRRGVAVRLRTEPAQSG